MTNRKNWIDTRYIVPERERERGPFHGLCLEPEQPLIMWHSFFFGNQPWIPLLPQLVLR